ncbi:MAG: helicase-associated domain-containing protein [Planctomycetota bacterium]
MGNLTLRTLVRGNSERDLRATLSRWGASCEEGHRRAHLVRLLLTRMTDGEVAHRRVKELPEKLADLLESFLREQAHRRDIRDLLGAQQVGFRSRFEVEASLVALMREGFVFPVEGQETWAVPAELASSILEQRRRMEAELKGTLSLKGFLQERYYKRAEKDPDGREKALEHARRVYKIYLLDESIRNRIRGLSEPVRAVFERALSIYGGLMPADELPKIAEDLEIDVDLDLVRKCFEEAMLGTVAPLRLERFGIEPIERTVVVFYEIALSCLQAWSDDHGPPRVDESNTAGVDLIGNVGRFLREVSSTRVQFTVDGLLYKASAKRITKNFLSIPGGYMPAETQARFIYQFCLSRRLVERSGERAFKLSPRGHEFEGESLIEKLRSLLAFAVEERAPQGEHYHQVRLRRILLRLLRRLEPDQWHEVLFVPFLARNGYLGKLDELNVEEYFASRFKTGDYVPTENTQQVCLHLADWVKRRLYPLGIVDIGLRDGRPAAIRLSRLGAELLGNDAAGDVGGARSTVVVNPDFELLLFPGDDEHEVVHVFDRFCERQKSDHVHHFRLCKESVHGALLDGMTLAQITQELTDRSRVPLPQNVVYSLEDWGDQAGVLILDDDRTLHARREELIERFLAQPSLGKCVQERIEATRVKLRRSADVEQLQDVARDLGFLIERRNGRTD